MRDQDALLQQFAEFLLQSSPTTEKAAPYCVGWVRRFLTRPAASQPVADQVPSFCDDLEREGRPDWQVEQAGHALHIYVLNFLQLTDAAWRQSPASAAIDQHGHADPLAALEQLRLRIRTRHYSYRTEGGHVDWARPCLGSKSRTAPASDNGQFYRLHRPRLIGPTVSTSVFLGSRRLPRG